MFVCVSLLVFVCENKSTLTNIIAPSHVCLSAFVKVHICLLVCVCLFVLACLCLFMFVCLCL